jgi:Flp pilus assembly protein TadD
MYELPAQVDLAGWPFLPALALFALATAVFVLVRRRWPGGLAAWTYSILMVLPVSGVVHAGSQLVNDRYSYLSGIGFAVLAGGAVLWVLEAAGRGRVSRGTATVFVGGAGLVVAALGVAAWTQTHVWRDSETLWRWAVDVDPACSLCHGNLGSAITATELGRARLPEAEEHLRRAIALRPDNPIPYYNLGTLLTVRNRYAEAEAALLRYRELAPYSRTGPGRLGLVYLLQGRYDEAIPLLERARGLTPPASAGRDGRAPDALARAVGLVEDDPGTLSLLGRSLVEQGHAAEAIPPLQRAVGLAPGAVPARFWLVRAYRMAGREDLARAEREMLDRLDPRAAEATAVR